MTERGKRRLTLDRWILAVGALAVLVRLAYLFEAGADPTFEHPIIDSSEYDALARSLAQGHNPWPGALTRPPLYPGLLAALYYLSGIKLAAAYVIHALSGGAACVLTCLLGRRLFDRRVGLAAGVVVALYGPMVFFDVRLLASSLVVVCYLTVLLLALRVAARSTWYNWLACGLATGVAALARPSIAPFFLIVLAAWIIATADREHRWRTQLLALVALGVGSLIPIVPVTVRNYLACGELIPISTLGGMNLYIGNNPDWQRTIAIRPGAQWDRLNRLPHVNGRVSAAGKEAYFLGRVADYIRTEPGDFVAGLLRKTRLYFNAREVPRNFDVYTHRRFSHLLTTLVWRTGPLAFPFGVLLPLAVVGFAVSYHHLRQRLIPAGFVLAAAASVILFFNASRYRMPVVPVLAVFAVWAVAWLCHCYVTGRKQRFAAGLIALVVLGVLVNLPAAVPTDRVNFEADLYNSVGGRLLFEGDLEGAAQAWRRALVIAPEAAELYGALSHVSARLGQSAEAVRYARQAVRIDPDLVDARVELGAALANLQVPDAAQAELERALQIEPTHPAAHSVLGQLLASQGRSAEAIDHLGRSLHVDNTDPAVYVALANLLITRESYAETVSVLEEAAGRLAAPDLRDALAWLLATCPDPAIRDPERAIRLAERNVAESQDRHPVYLDTLAAAYAAAGRFDEAAERAARAVGIARAAGAESLAEAMAARRRLYLAKQPCRNPLRPVP